MFDVKTNRGKERLLILSRRALGLWQSTTLMFTILAAAPVIAGDIHGAYLKAAIGIAALVSILTALGRVVLSDTVVDASDVVALNIAPMLGSIPEMPNG